MVFLRITKIRFFVSKRKVFNKYHDKKIFKYIYKSNNNKLNLISHEKILWKFII